MNTCYVKDKERGSKDDSPLNANPEKQELALVGTMEAQRASSRGAEFRLLLSLTVPEGTSCGWANDGAHWAGWGRAGLGPSGWGS